MKRSAPPRPSADELLVAQFEALLAELDFVADNAAFGQTCDDMELFLLDKGRKLLQETFEQKLQERVKKAEQNDEAKQCPHCKKKRSTSMRRRKPSSPSTEKPPSNAAIAPAPTAKKTPFLSKSLSVCPNVTPLP